MNSNSNNPAIGNFMMKVNLKTMIMGIVLITATFLVTSNTNGTTFAQTGGKNIGCANTVKVTISHLPKQTADASTQMTLSNLGPNADQGKGSISLPGIGSGQVFVIYALHANEYYSHVQNLPGQTAVNDDVVFSGNDICNSKDPQSAGLYLPGIGYGAISITKVK